MPKTSGIGFHGVTTISEFLSIQSLILYNYTVYIYIYIYIYICMCTICLEAWKCISGGPLGPLSRGP